MSDNTVVTENTVTNIVEVTSAGPAGPPGGSLTIQDNGVSEGLLTDKLNFAGSTVSVNNDTVNEIATVTVNAATPGANANITSMTGVTGGISSPDFIQFDTASGATGAVGRMLWNDTDGTLEFQMKGGNVTLQVGQEEVVRVTNQYGSTISDGQAVYITGSTGNHLNVTLAQANSEVTSSKTLAVVAESIANNGTGFATTSGLIRNLNTSALTEGAAIWLSPTVPGGLTSTKPVAPNHAVLIGWCVKQHATVGVIYVHIANGYELEELHNVLITSVANNQVLRYDSATSLWKNATISPTLTLAGAVTGSGTLTDLGDVTITTTATSDPTLTLSGDASGSATFTNLGDATLTVTVADNSHDHTIANVTGLQTALDLKAPLASPTFTGSVTLPATTAIGTVSATEIGYLDGVTSAIQTQIDTKLASASYTAADVLTKIKTVDGSGSGLDADLLDGQDSAYYTAINARLGYTAENAANKGVAGGYASLDGSGTVPTSQLPAAVLGAVKYQGTWNASTNSPTLTSSVGTQGYYYVVSVAGSTNLNGITDWVVGDWAIYNGSTWQKIDNTDAVTSVAGRTGAVTLSASDVSGLATVATSGAISDTTGTLAVGRGGTGATSLTSGYLVKGNGTSAASASVVYDDGTNVGIGTSSPSSKFVVSNSGAAGFEINPIGSASAPALYSYNRNTNAYDILTTLASEVRWQTGASPSERMRLDTSGNLGLGVTPSAWGFGGNLELAATNNIAFQGSGNLLFNSFYSVSGGTYLYKTNGLASRYQSTAGQHLWFTAPSGTAGTAITFTQAMTLDASGNLGIGTTSPTTKLHVSQYAGIGATIDRVGDFGPSLQLIRNGVSGSAALGLALDSTLGVYTDNTERMRITNTGDVGIGTSSPISTLDVTGSSGITTTSGGNTGRMVSAAGGVYIGSTTNADVIFQTNQAEKMRITSAGNVGIGTSAPTSYSGYGNLTVNGTNGGTFTLRNTANTSSSEMGATATDAYLKTVSSTPLWFGTGNTERMRLDSSGNVGIGTSSPGAKLALSTNTNNGILIDTPMSAAAYAEVRARYTGQDNCQSAIRFYNPNNAYGGALTLWTQPESNGAAMVERMRLDASGNVGIGASSPSQKLVLEGASGVALQIQNSSDSNRGGRISATGSAGSGTFAVNTTSSGYALTFGIDTTERMRLDTSGNLGVGTSSPISGTQAGCVTAAGIVAAKGYLNAHQTSAGILEFYSNVTRLRSYGATAGTGAIAFNTGGGGGSIDAEAMRIDSSGNVLIGATSASGNSTLRVSSSSTRAYALVDTTATTGAEAGLRLKASRDWYTISDYDTGALKWFDATAGADRMRIDSSGNVAVGQTTTPARFTSQTSNYGDASAASSNVPFYGKTFGGTTSSFRNVFLGQVYTNSSSQFSNVQITLFSGNDVGGQSAAIALTSSNALAFYTNGGNPSADAQVGTERARFDASGNFAIGCTGQTGDAPNQAGGTLKEANGNTKVRVTTDNLPGFQFYSPTGGTGSPVGSITVGASATAYNTSSDARLKHDIVDAPSASSLIDAIKVRSFKWNANNSEQRYGMVAQELLEVAPEAVSVPADEEAMMGVDYSKLVPMLIKEVQSLRARVAQLEGK